MTEPGIFMLRGRSPDSGREGSLTLKRETISYPKDKVLILVVTPLVLYVLLLPLLPLTEPDEARYSDIPSSMNQSGDYIIPRLNHVVYLEKPPFAYWVTAFFFRLFGEGTFSSRLFSGLCAWGCVFLVYRIGNTLYDERAGLHSAAVLSTSLYPFILGRLNLLDMPLTFLLGLSIWSGYRYFRTGSEKKRWLYLFYLFAALAFLTKGLIGILFPLLILILYLLSEKAWQSLPKLFHPLGIVLFAAIVSPWFILVQRAYPHFFQYFFVRQHFERYTTDAYGSVHFLYYIPVILFGMIPWLAHLVEALVRPGTRKVFRETVRHGLLLSWMGFVFLFFSISSSKMATYIAPLFLPLAVVVGRTLGIEETENPSPQRRSHRLHTRVLILAQSILLAVALWIPPFLRSANVPLTEWWLLVLLPTIVILLIPFLIARAQAERNRFLVLYVLSAVFLAASILPLSRYLRPYKASLPVAEAIKRLVPAGHDLYQYRIYLRGIPFYCKIRTPIVGRPDELATGRDLLPAEEKARYFLRVDQFYELGKERGELYVVTKGKDKIEELKGRAPSLDLLWRNETFSLFRLRFG